MSHPFHPLFGKEFEVQYFRHDWGERRVHFLDEAGYLVSIPIAWTDAAESDPFLEVSSGRSWFRVEDLLRLAGLLEELKK